MKFVQLNRTFIEFADKEADEATIESSTWAGSSWGRIGWTDLLEKPCTIVLGEAGIGKTREFEEQSRDLANSGANAFFLDLGILAQEGLLPCLWRDDQERLRKWADGSEAGVLFLDSLDEARLHSRNALPLALRKLDSALGKKLACARLVISCRMSDWRVGADLRAVEEFAVGHNLGSQIEELKRSNEPARQTQEKVRVVQLAPLILDQVASLAASLGMKDSTRFIEEIRRAGAQAFVGRPRDVEWMVEYWERNRRLGTLTELIEFDITKKLSESNPTHAQEDPLSSEQARVGAEGLAVAALFCKSMVILLPDSDVKSGESESAIEPDIILPTWTPREIQALLTRPIFDEATYGRVRFHHRAIAEYLSARWLQSRLLAGCSKKSIQQILFRETHGRTIAVPSLSGVTSWVAGFEEHIRHKALEVAPEVVLLGGDPTRIRVQDRAKALENLANRYKTRRNMGWWLDKAEVRRIAHPDLVPTINRLLSDFQVNTDVQEMLLNIAALGGLVGCSKSALRIAQDTSESNETRACAIKALRSLGSNEELKEMADYARNSTGLPNQLIGALCANLFPEFFSVADTVALIEMAERETLNRKTALPFAIEHHVVDECPKKYLLELLSELTRIVQLPPAGITVEGLSLSGRFLWVFDAIPRLFVKTLKSIATEELFFSKLKAPFRLMQTVHENQVIGVYRLGEISKELKNFDWLRREIFWDRVRSAKQLEGSISRIWHGYRDLCPLAAPDLEWLINDVRDLSENSERRSALEAAFRIWDPSNRNMEKYEQCILEAVKDDTGLFELAEQWITWKRNPPTQEMEIDSQQKKLDWENKQKLQFDHWLEEVRQNIDAVENGKAFGQLYDLTRRIDDAKGNYRYGHSGWQTLIPVVGEEVAAAARSGFVTFWRSWKPDLPHQRENPNTIDIKVIVGLTGLGIEVAEGLVLTQLSDEEAHIASCYAFNEIGGFPDWLPTLTKTHPRVVRDVLREIFQAEFDFDATSSHSWGILSALQQQSGEVCDFAAPMVLDSLERSDPRRVQVLGAGLRVLLSATRLDEARFCRLAEQRVLQYAGDGNSESLVRWLVAWIYVDSGRAWEFVELFICSNWLVGWTVFRLGLTPAYLLLHACISREIRTFIAVLGAELLQPFGLAARVPRRDRFTASVLRDMMRVFYFHVPPQDDPWHEDAYTPNFRDTAKDFRNYLARKLAELTSRAAHSALLELAEEQTLSDNRDWFLYLADQNLGNAAESARWDPRDIDLFAKTWEKDPCTPAELFNIAVSRLEDLRLHIESGDFSERSLFKPGMPEEDIQKWFAARLQERAAGRYLVTREEEVDNHKKPDLRLHHQKAGRVGIEVKPTSKGRYTYSELETALRVQLVGQYLRAFESRHGVLLLVNLENRKWKPGGSKGVLEFRGLVEMLNSEAKTLVEQDGNIDSVLVFGIDFVAQSE